MSADSIDQCTTPNKKIFPKTPSAPPEKHSSPSDKAYFDRSNSPPPPYEIACQLKGKHYFSCMNIIKANSFEFHLLKRFSLS